MHPSSEQGPDRRAIRRGGMVGLVIAGGLIALAAFFVVRLEEPSEVLGVFLPLSVGLIAGALAVMALVPLRLGDGAASGPAIARGLRALAVLGVVLTAAGVVRGELPWVAFALLPLVVCGLLVRSSGRFARLVS